MQLKTKIKNTLRGLTGRWGPSSMKRKLWDTEYAAGKWTHCENTAGDPIYGYIQKYCGNGSILDLGCGSGNTSNELEFTSYQSYTGVDISDVAIQKAAQRSEGTGRGKKNRYFQSDILSYTPSERHDVILFRDSINSLPQLKMKSTLDRYLPYLSERGVFIVRVSGDATRKYQEIAAEIEANYKLIEKYSTPASGGAFILVFR